MTPARATSTWTEGLDPHIAPDLARSALIVIDAQVDFLDGGANPIEGTTAVLPAIRSLLAAHRGAGRPIVHVVRLYDGEDVDRPRRTAIDAGAALVRPGSPGSQVAPDLRAAGQPDLDPATLLAGRVQQLGAGEVALWKPRWNAFHRTPLDAHLTGLGVDTVVVAGCNYPNCPRASVYGASERDYRILIASDAISGVVALHLEEATRIGAVHAEAAAIVAGVASSGWATDRRAPRASP